MNVFTAIMLVFAAVGFADKALDGRWGLSEEFDKGLATMGVMVIPIVSICAVGTEFIQRHTDTIMGWSDHLFCDPTTIIGAILAPDMGGYFICRELTDLPAMLLLNGVVLGTLLGQAITFQLPVFMAGVERKFHSDMFRGFIVGIILVPSGFLVSELMIRMPIGLYLRQFLPIFIICLIMAFFLYKTPEGIARVFGVFARIINYLFYFMFAVTVIGIFIPSLAYASEDSIIEAIMIVFKAAIIIGGSLVMSRLILKFFGKQIRNLADRIEIDEISAVSLLMTCATSLAVIPLFPKMNPKGRQVVTAFSLSGSFVIGGSMAFVSSVADGYAVAVFIVSKLVCGIISVIVIHKMWKKKVK